MSDRFALAAGSVLDRRYRIERVIGAGGFGITYKAFNRSLGIHVAVKEYFPAQYGVRDSTMSVRPRTEVDHELFARMLASFQREARTLASLDHPAIVRVLSTFEEHGTSYMVMRFEAGLSLKHWLESLDGRPSQDQLDTILEPLLSALETIHARDFLHRDIAPDNIIIRPDGQPVLIDFGASRRVVGDLTGIMTGIVKTGYSPQEQYVPGSRLLGPWSDIYALGATLYHAVTGGKPTDASARVIEDRMVPAAEAGRGHGYRPALLDAIDWALAVKPADRPQSIADWRRLLLGPEQPAHEARTGVHRRSDGADDVQPAFRTADRGDIEPEPAPVSRRSWTSTLALLAGVLLVVIGVGLLVMVAAALWRDPVVGTLPSQGGSGAPGRLTAAEQRVTPSKAQRAPDARERSEVDAGRLAEERRSAALAEAELIGRLQRELARAGCEPGAEDGRWGADLERALERFARQTQAGIVTDLPTREALEAVEERPGRVCPLVCGEGEVETDGRCVTRREAGGAGARPQRPASSDEARSRQRERRETEEDRERPRRRQSDAESRERPSGRSCEAFPRPRVGETCVRDDGKTCIWGGGAGACN